MGDKDEIVPLQSVIDWFDAVPLSSDNGEKMFDSSERCWAWLLSRKVKEEREDDCF